MTSVPLSSKVRIAAISTIFEGFGRGHEASPAAAGVFADDPAVVLLVLPGFFFAHERADGFARAVEAGVLLIDHALRDDAATACSTP